MGRKLRLVMIVGLALLGGCADRSVPTNSPPSRSPSPSSPSPKPVDPYLGWKTYTSVWEKASFRYPVAWKVKVLANDAQGGPHGEGVTLTSPTGISITWFAPVYGIGGGCDASKSPHGFVDRIFPLDARTEHPMSIILASLDGHKALAVVDDEFVGGPKLGDTGECLVYTLFHSRTHRDYTLIQFSPVLELGNRAGLGDRLSDDQYLALPDVKIAMMIYRSFRY